MSRVSRRRFVQAGLALASLILLVGCGVFPPQAQQPAKVPRVGYLGGNPRETISQGVEGMLDALSKLGYVEAQTMIVEWRFAESTEQLPALVAELVALEVDLIISTRGQAAQAAKQATSTIPIVLVRHPDPIGTGLVASLSRPGGNITGTTNYSPTLAGKRLQILREVAPGAGPIAYLVNPDNPSFATQEREIGEAAATLQVQLVRLPVRAASDLNAAFSAASAQGVAGLVVLGDNMVLVPQAARIAELARQHRLPSMSGIRRHPEAGGLISYGDNVAAGYDATARIVDKILKGAKPGDLPVEGPTTFEVVPNRKTAQALRLTIPESVRLQVTEVIE